MDFLDRFATGEFDSTLHATRIPATSGRFWPWVKGARTQATLAAAAAAVAMADAKAKAATEAAAAALQGAEEANRAHKEAAASAS